MRHLFILALTSAALAAPSGWSLLQRYQKEPKPVLLQQARQAFLKAGDKDGVLALESLELSQKLRTDRDQVIARTELLRKDLANVPPGPGRARFFMLMSDLAQQSRQLEDVRRFEELALAEPEPDPETRATRVLQIAIRREWDAAPLAPDLQKELQRVADAQVSDLVFQQLLEYRATREQRNANPDAARAFRLARLRLQTSVRSQVFTLSNLSHFAPTPEQRRRDWDEALRRVARVEGDTLDLYHVLLAGAPDLQRARQAHARAHRLNPLEADTWLAGWQDFQDPRPTSKTWKSLTTRYALAGRADQAMQLRVRLARQLQREGSHAQAADELQQVIHWRQGRPRSRFDPEDTSLGRLAVVSAELWTSAQQPRRALGVVLQALEHNWAANPQEEALLLAAALRQGSSLGEQQPALWMRLRRLLPRLETFNQATALHSLRAAVPTSDSGRRLEMLAELRDVSRGLVADAPDRASRGRAHRELSFALGQLGDLAGQREALEAALQDAKAADDRNLEQDIQQSLLNFYSREEPARALPLAREILERPQIPTWLKDSALVALTETPSSEALRWADALIAHRGQDRTYLASALQRKAVVQRRLGQREAAYRTLDEIPGPSHLASLKAHWLLADERPAEALAFAEGAASTLLSGENRLRATDFLVAAAQARWQLGQPWLPPLETGLAAFAGLPGAAEQSRALLATALRLFAKEQRWSEGIAFARRYPVAVDGIASLRAMPEYAELFRAAEGVEKDVLTLLDELRLARPELGHLLSLRSSNVAALQAHLQPGQTLVSYLSMPDSLYVILLGKERRSWRRVDIPQPRLAQLVKDFRSGVITQKPQETARSILHAALIQPLPANHEILVVPTGELWTMPLSALASDKDFTWLGSGDVLRLADGVWQPFRPRHPLAIGAPPAADLPQALQELLDFGRAFPAARVISGEQATPAALRGAAFDLLHVATHAHYNAARPLDSRVQLHGGDLLLRDLHSVGLAEGALVALSVCEGGVGDTAGPEPLSLASAISAAGAHTVVAHQWQVDDAAARVFFRSFYETLAAGKSPRAAFRAGQDACREAFPDPFYWAGFFLVGSSR